MPVTLKSYGQSICYNLHRAQDLAGRFLLPLPGTRPSLLLWQTGIHGQAGFMNKAAVG